MSDLPGYLDAFGVPVRVKGVEYLGILDDEYEQIELGRVRIASNSPMILFAKSQIAMMQLELDDELEIFDELEESWSRYVVRSIQPRTDGFSMVRAIEAT